MVNMSNVRSCEISNDQSVDGQVRNDRSSETHDGSGLGWE